MLTEIIMAVTTNKKINLITQGKKSDHQNSEDIARKALQNCMKSKFRKLSKDVFHVKK
jgi:hypothetical protein